MTLMMLAPLARQARRAIGIRDELRVIGRHRH